MKDLVKSLNNLPLLAKLILCIPGLDIVWSIGRVCNGLAKKDTLWTVIGILTIVPGAAFMWAVDAVLILLRGKPFGMA